VALGDTVLTLSNATIDSMEANWEPAGGDGLTGYEISYEPVSETEEETSPDTVGFVAVKPKMRNQRSIAANRRPTFYVMSQIFQNQSISFYGA